MYKKLILIFLLFSFSCKEKNGSELSLDNSLTKALMKNSDGIKPNLISKLETNISADNKNVEINLVLNRNSIVNEIHQKVYLSYIFSKTNELNKYEKTVFNYHLKNEEFNSQTLEIPKEAGQLIRDRFKFEPFENYLKYCLSDFDAETVFGLNIWIDNINLVYPNELLNTDFFEVLEKLSYECSDVNKEKDAKATIVILYIAIKDYVEKSTPNNPQLNDQKHNQKILEDLWKMCNNGEMIQFAEQRLFGKVGGNWDKYSKYNSQD